MNTPRQNEIVKLIKTKEDEIHALKQEAHKLELKESVKPIDPNFGKIKVWIGTHDNDDSYYCVFYENGGTLYVPAELGRLGLSDNDKHCQQMIEACHEYVNGLGNGFILIDPPKKCAWCGKRLADEDPKRFCVSPEDQNITCCNPQCYHSYLGNTAKCTTDGKPPIDPNAHSAPGPIGKDGQHEQYWVLCDAERKKGFVRPVRRTYVHVGVGGHEIDPNNPAKSGLKGNGCGVATTMGTALAETAARDPGYYGSTFCVGCQKHFPVYEFRWNDGELVGS